MINYFNSFTFTIAQVSQMSLDRSAMPSSESESSWVLAVRFCTELGIKKKKFVQTLCSNVTKENLRQSCRVAGNVIFKFPQKSVDGLTAS